MSTELTHKQYQVLRFIKDSVEKDGVQPSLKEIANKFGVTVGAIRTHLIYCEKKGYIQLTGKIRYIKFLKKI